MLELFKIDLSTHTLLGRLLKGYLLLPKMLMELGEKKTDSGILPNLICVYPPITWNATKVYAPTETPTPITPPEGKEVEVPSPTFKPSPTPTVTPVPLTPTPIPTPSPTATATEIPTPEEAVPGFEAIFAITGLLAVAYLLRRRK